MDHYTRDHSSGFHYYATSQGSTMNHTKTTPWPPPIPELPSSLIDSPASSQFSSDASDTGASPGAWVDQHVYEDHLPLLTKDPKLQAYFFRMEKTLRTCHPTALHTEAANLTRDLVVKPMDVESVRTVAKTLAKAGYRKIEYSRSCALIAHEIFCQLQSTLPDASVSFMECLVGTVTEIFDGYYLGVTTCTYRTTVLGADHRSGQFVAPRWTQRTGQCRSGDDKRGSFCRGPVCTGLAPRAGGARQDHRKSRLCKSSINGPLPGTAFVPPPCKISYRTLDRAGHSGKDAQATYPVHSRTSDGVR